MPTKKRTLGKLTPELTRAICDLVERGQSLTAAAVLLGHTPSLVSEWMARGEGRGSKPKTLKYEAFALAIRAAQERDVSQKLDRINRAAAGGNLKMTRTVTTRRPDGTEITRKEDIYLPADWKADAWLLEKTHKERFGKTESTTQDGRPQVVVVLPDNGRSPGKSGSVLPGVRRRKEITAPAQHPGAPADALNPGEKAKVPSIHSKVDNAGKQSDPGCPDCGHAWRLHRLDSDGAGTTCCGGACRCERSGV